MLEQDNVVDLQPFTAGMRDAIKQARFSTTFQGRNLAIVYDSDKALIEATGCQFTRYQRAPQSEPELWDYEARSNDPRVIEYVAGLRAP